MCLSYLKWRYTKKFEDKKQMVELAKEFRKQEGRQGKLHRTIIEKRIRKFFREVKKMNGLEASRVAAKDYAKGQRDRGEGIHSPEELELKKQRWKEVRAKQSASGNEPNAMVWVVTDPDGKEFLVKSLSRFCRDMGFNNKGLHATANRPWEKETYEGYKARHYDPLLDVGIPWNEKYKPKNWDEV
jgi:hypothetical protein